MDKELTKQPQAATTPRKNDMQIEVYQDIYPALTVHLPEWPAGEPPAPVLTDPEQFMAVGVCQWLVGLGHVTKHQPKAFRLVTKSVRRGRQGHDCRVAVVYTSELVYDRCMATESGTRQIGQKYWETKIWVAGGLFKIHMDGTAYNLPGHDGDWYVAAHSPHEIKPGQQQFHPFGASLIMGRWPHERFKERIDAHEKPYKRHAFYLLPL